MRRLVYVVPPTTTTFINASIKRKMCANSNACTTSEGGFAEISTNVKMRDINPKLMSSLYKTRTVIPTYGCRLSAHGSNFANRNEKIKFATKIDIPSISVKIVVST